MGHTPGSANEFGGAIEIDDGTNARTETPPPGSIGLDAPSGAGTSAGIADRIVGFAKRQRGNRVGNGECFTFADHALSASGARSAGDFGSVTPDADYVWGSTVALNELQPGDVIQLRDYRYDREVEVNNPDGSGSNNSDFQERPHHTVIVESVDGKVRSPSWSRTHRKGPRCAAVSCSSRTAIRRAGTARQRSRYRARSGSIGPKRSRIFRLKPKASGLRSSA